MDSERTESIRLRVSPAEKEALVASAEAIGKNVSDHLRDSALPRPERPAPKAADADFIVRRAAQLEGEGLPTRSARILAAREANTTGHKIGDIFHPPERRSSRDKRERLTALREAFARDVGGGSAA